MMNTGWSPTYATVTWGWRSTSAPWAARDAFAIGIVRTPLGSIRGYSVPLTTIDALVT